MEEAYIKFQNYLRSLVPFDKDAFEAGKQYFELQELNKGDLFAEVGKACRYFGFVVSGLMRAWYLEDGNEITTCLCTDNFFATSTSSFISQKPSEINIEAVEPTVILSISYTHLDKLYSTYGFWAGAGRKFLEQEFMDVDCRNRCYMKQTPDEKYLTLVRETPDLLNRVPLYVIASYLNITPETLSRIRKRTLMRIS